MNIISNARGLSVKAKALTGTALIGGLLVGGVALGGAANAATDSEPSNTASVTDVPGPTPTDHDYYWDDQKIDSIAITQNPDDTYTTEVYVNGKPVGSVTGPQPAEFPTTPQTSGGDQATPTHP